MSTNDERANFMKEVSHRIAIGGWEKHVEVVDTNGFKNIIPILYDETLDTLVQRLLWSDENQGTVFVRLQNGHTVVFQATGLTGAVSGSIPT